jgi:phosphoglycerate dehydrogenase-like enzyme
MLQAGGTTNRIRGAYVCAQREFDLVYGQTQRRRIAATIDIEERPIPGDSVAEDPAQLDGCEVILSTWGAPHLSEEVLDAAPKLRAVFYAAGSIKHIVSEAFWRRNIVITSAYAANAVPVAEFTIAQINMCLKNVWRSAAMTREARTFKSVEPAGMFGTTVGIVSLGMIGRLVVEKLRRYDVNVIAYDPFISADHAAELGVELCSLEDVFTLSDVVSLHTPWLPETEGLVKGHHFASMKPNASFINTARGAIVAEQEMIDVLRQRPDLFAVLDVTHPEPPAPESPLYDMPNVVLTPHIAGSLAAECQRMAAFMVDELERFVAGKPLRWTISRERSAFLA